MNSRTAIVFPGQGTQRCGMARDFHSHSRLARDVFGEASEALSLDLAALCFEEDARLHKTEFAQPAILTTEIAMWRVIAREFGVPAQFFGGHSLGEYTALVAAGVIPLSDAVRLTRRRGALMQSAVPEGRGGMIAVICRGAAGEAWPELAREASLDVANLNSRDQVVLSGTVDAIAAAKARIAVLLAQREFRIVDLNVSAPFHCRLLKGIEADFGAALRESVPHWAAESGPSVTSNYTGTFHRACADSIAHGLLSQICAPVQWLSNMTALCEAADRIIEIGPDRPLKGFFRSVGRAVLSISSFESAERDLCNSQGRSI
jgi:[acyl-carrier-protein] S-malonyltransferase